MTTIGRDQVAFNAFLRDGLGVLGLPLDARQLLLLERFRRLVLEENRVQNLTSITGPYDFAVRHVLDSLTCLVTGLLEGEARLADLGSGAGFPGVPLKIARPALDVTLVDSSRKRAAFLSTLVSALGLDRCEVLAMRAEELGRRAERREAYDLVVVRAVASLPADLECAVPLLARGGRFVAMKGPKAAGELPAAERAAALLGARLERVLELRLPLSGDRRALVVFRKETPTPDKYPRRPGLPARKPLGVR
ncbi:MAG: 16S rRNA (guanine(527)-N(7))-methyltransferase RsmG [Bacillota bacterium]